MAKSSSAFDLTLPPRDRSVPAYRWLCAALKAEILKGRLRPGTRLPSTRNLAAEYGLARGTIVNAFEQLQSEGYIAGSIGSGTRVSPVLPENLSRLVSGEATKPAKRSKRRTPGSAYGRRVQLFPNFENSPVRAFRCNLPALDLFPVTTWAKITARRWREVTARLLMGCEALGYLPLREALADYLVRFRGVQCNPEQVVIVSGTQEALDLAARLLLDPGDSACMESPGYLGATLVLRALGARIIAAGVDGEGIDVQSLARRGVRLVYVTPAHQFPLGTTMSMARRLQLLAWAGKANAIVFEDDYDSEFRYSGQPIPALQGLDRGDRVIYAGSFSKVLFPSLRLGYMIVPEFLLGRVAAAKSLTSRHAPVMEQSVLNDFIREGHFARHLRRMRKIYSERLAVLLEESRLRLAGLLEVSNVQAGLQTTASLCNGMSGRAASQAAAKRGISVTPVSDYGPEASARNMIQLGFAAMNPAEIRRGIRELEVALRKPTAQLAARR